MDIRQIARSVRKQLKAEFPGCQFSVRIARYSGGHDLTVSLMIAPFEAYKAEYRGCITGYCYTNLSKPDTSEFYGTLTNRASAMLKRVDEIVNGHEWHIDNAITRDFNIDSTFNLEVGQLDKPFFAQSQDSQN